MGGYVRAMRQYAVFRGRASRAEFWQFTAVLVGLFIVALFVDGAVTQNVDADLQKKPGGIFSALLILAHLVPAFSVTVRRLHDTDHSGWLVLLNYVPPLNLVIVAFACMRGTVGANRYGTDPLNPMALSTAPAATGVRVDPGSALSASLPAAPVRSDVIAELERLGQLRRDGHLSEAEFEVMKSETLAQARR
ncbi:DUF805 domain-containing protein [Methylobacterium sp. J-030]|uniref:DUF805 domain-containing protein n=1 Tax=Methylobacterium sp. J-030 TaxID=2836627 RepID=UPI001FBB591A|nr:DUF805 domain-containing protein [Methylobacterium sp. J-030]MCJ2070977.1 DUF805 domain-containing protein [Methylobacterium sp. J-030]